MKSKINFHDESHYYNIIKNNIKKIRQELNLTEQDLADILSVPIEYITNLEKEDINKRITIATLGRIADALNIPISRLFENKK